MTLAQEVLGLALADIRAKYLSYRFMTGRDVTWILQKTLLDLIDANGYPLEVYHDYPLCRGRRVNQADELVIVASGMNYRDLFDQTASAELVIRVLFEPSRHRRDICEYQLPRVLSSEWDTHLTELKQLKESQKTKATQLIFIDEDSRHATISSDPYLPWNMFSEYEPDGFHIYALVI